MNRNTKNAKCPFFRNFTLILLFLTGALLLNCQQRQLYFHAGDLRAPATIKAERERFKKNLIENTIYHNLAAPLILENESNWRNALWAAELIFCRSERTFFAIRLALSKFAEISVSLQRAVIEAAYCLYPTEFVQNIQEIANTTQTPKIFAMAICYLLKNADSPIVRRSYLERLKSRFPNWHEDAILLSLANALRTPPTERIKNRPSLVEILKHPFEAGKPIIYCFQRLNRDFPGLTVLKRPDGKFFRDKNGAIFHIAHLARSSANLPGFLTNGNTPQGIFSVQGIDTSQNVFIGPTPNLQLVLPFEASVKTFFHQANSSDTIWTNDKYASLLPNSWKDYEPIYEAFYAGAAGRNEIIAHGTTIDPDFYLGESYYPFTPSLGCLTTLEIWSERDGGCVFSDQIILMNTFLASGKPEGYLVVIEIDNKAQPVTLQELIREILQAEGTIS